MLFDERPEYAQRILTQNCLSEKKPTAEAACLIRYLRYIGKGEEEIQKTLTKMFRKIYYTPSRPDMTPFITPAYQMATKLPPIRTDSLVISKEQLDIISQINNQTYEDFVFAALVIYLYYNKNNDRYVVKFKDALAVAGIHSYKEVTEFLRSNDIVTLRQFHNCHYIEISDKLLTNCNISGIVLDNFLNVCYYYDEYRGYGKFTRCEHCGCIVKQPSRSSYRKYCKACWQRVNSIKTWQREQERRIETP